MSEIELRDAILRHSLQILRVSAGEEAVVEEILRQLERDLRKLLESRSLNTAGRREIERLIREADEAIRPAYAAAAERVDTRTLAVIVAEHTVETLDELLPLTASLPSREVLDSLSKDVMIDGAPSSAWWKRQAEDTTWRFAAQVRQGVINGETNERIVQRIVGTRTEPGVMQIARRNARTLVHSSVMTAANEARLATFRKNGRLIAGVRWLSTLDGRTCRVCMALDGQAWDLDGDKLKGTRVAFEAPPKHFSCFPADTAVLSRSPITGASKRWFDGEVVVIKTAAGRELTCTPNHPILTDRGWIAAGLLDVGCNVVCDLTSEWKAGADGDGENVPALIHDVAEATFRTVSVGPMPVPLAAEDFHGDGRDGDVAIIGADGFLRGTLETTLAEPCDQSMLIARGAAGLVPFTGEGDAATLIERADPALGGSIGGGHLGGSLCARHTSPFQRLGLGSTTPLYSGLSEDARGYDALDAVLFGDSVFGHPAQVVRADTLAIDDGSGPGWYAAMLQFAHDDGVRDASLAADLSGIRPTQIELDAVIECARVGFSDHVYNLETSSGWYIAQGVVVHNCRCVLSPIPRAFKELGIDLDEPGGGTRASSMGPVPASTTFDEFLKRQSSAFVERVLGEERAALWRAGTITLRDLVSGTGRELTIEELRN